MGEEKPKPFSKQIRFFRAHVISFALAEIMIFFAGLYDCHPYYLLATRCVVFASSLVFAATTNSLIRVFLFLAVAILSNPFVEFALFEPLLFVLFVFFIVCLIIEGKENNREYSEHLEFSVFE